MYEDQRCMYVELYAATSVKVLNLAYDWHRPRHAYFAVYDVELTPPNMYARKLSNCNNASRCHRSNHRSYI